MTYLLILIFLNLKIIVIIIPMALTEKYSEFTKVPAATLVSISQVGAFLCFVAVSLIRTQICRPMAIDAAVSVAVVGGFAGL